MEVTGCSELTPGPPLQCTERDLGSWLGFVALYIDERQPDGPAARMIATFRHDQEPAVSLVEAVSLIDTVTRFNARNIALLCAAGDRSHEKQTKKKGSDHWCLAGYGGGYPHACTIAANYGSRAEKRRSLRHAALFVDRAESPPSEGTRQALEEPR